MQELFDELLDYLKGIWIQRRYIIIASWLICPIGWLTVSSMPDVYESKARIYADTQSILAPLLKGLTVQTNPDIQINLMIKTLLSRSNLERISRMTDMDIQAETPQQYERLIKHLKENIKIIKARGRDNIFTISFQDENPEMAKSVVQSALTVFIENTLGENRTDADSAQKFLKSQIKEYENRLATAEGRLTNFKQKYSNLLPDQYGGYYNKLNIAKEQLQTIELSLKEAQTQLNSAKAQLGTAPTDVNSAQNKIQTSNSIKTSYDDRISELELTLDSLQLRYTDKHPDVAEAKRSLKHLEDQRSKEINNYLDMTDSNKDGSKQITSQNPVIQQLQIQVNQYENQVALITVRVNDYRSKVKELENKIYILPEIEAKLVALNRGYQITKKKYEELLNRQETAQLAQQADETTNKIQFKVIDPPRAATAPSGPKRILLFIAITFIGFGAGIGVSLLLSQLSPVVTSTAQLSKATGVPVFGVVSANVNLNLQTWHKKKKVIFIVSNLFLLLILVIFMSYFLFPDAIQAPLKRMF